MKDYTKLSNINRQNENLAISAYDKGYNAGLEDNKAYQEGLNAAWECARKIVLVPYPYDGGCTYSEAFDGLSPHRILKDFSASEVITKIKEYEENRIKIGDEVCDKDCKSSKVVVTGICNGVLFCISEDGTSCDFEIPEVEKTGRHFPQIVEMFKQMKGE